MTNDEKIQKIKEIIKQDWDTMIIMWDVWVWKTYIAQNYIKHDYFIWEPTFKQLLVSWQLIIRPPDMYNCDINMRPLSALCKKNIIIYDDFGVADETSAYIEKTMFWLDYRIQHKKKTIFTTNLSLENLKKREKRIISRMMQNTIMISLTWPDHRKKNTKFIQI